ncbi:heat shock 70 kDa protein 12A-like [Mytilus trossulus]|uniref:heat shock 70 kDa protein 12A-like n=1 Tax=Mytilus trossulus TaxID=6551 RepID=UPI003007C0AA
MATVASKKLVVAAIDFGTAFSGYAYCSKHDYDEYLQGNEEQPRIKCQTWSSEGGLTPKAPTCVLFRPNQMFHSFGYEAQTYYRDHLNKGDLSTWFYFENFKMMLYKERDELTKDTWLKESINVEGITPKRMKAVEVFAAVIEYFKGQILKSLLTSHGDKVTSKTEIKTDNSSKKTDTFSNDDFHWVLTVPAIWDLKAKQFMRDAAEKAGISKEQLSLALEPEAASVHCRKQPVTVKEQPCGNKAIASLEEGDQYMVFDQGGGTTDITVHEVTGPSSVKEIHQACGGYWGGNTVNGEFYKFLVKLFGGFVINDVKKNHPADYFELMHNFERNKTSFKLDTDKVTIRIPVAWLDTYKESTKQKLKDVIPQTRFNNKIELSNDKMRIKHSLFRSFFDYSITNVTDELDKLFKKQELSGVHTLLAVGGFSESSVLIDAVKQKLGQKVDVIVPRDPGLAVLKGAVMFGFEPGTIESRVSRYTYGVAMQRHYIDGFDDASKRPSHGSLIDDVFDIHVKKGQVVKIGHFGPEHTYFPVVDDLKCAHFEFFASEEKDPKYTTEKDCSMLGVLSVDLTRKDSKDGELSLKINASGTEIVAVVKEKATKNEYRAYFCLF